MRIETINKDSETIIISGYSEDQHIFDAYMYRLKGNMITKTHFAMAIHSVGGIMGYPYGGKNHIIITADEGELYHNSIWLKKEDDDRVIDTFRGYLSNKLDNKRRDYMLTKTQMSEFTERYIYGIEGD